MTGAEYIQAERLRKAGGIPGYTLEYLDARKEAERKERWCWQNWIRMLIYFLPYQVAIILSPELHILWVYKFFILVVCMGLSAGFYGRSFSRAVLKRLDAQLRAPED